MGAVSLRKTPSIMRRLTNVGNMEILVDIRR